jgi:thiamine-phosphate pyrophosphorylase
MDRASFPRVYPILDTATISRLNVDAIVAAAALLEGGARILQFRHKGFWSRDVFAQATEIARLCREVSAIFVVNDRADYARILNAGLHLGQDDLFPADARRVVGPDALIGFSTHNAKQMKGAEAEPVDYVAFGPVFATASKERPDPTVGIEMLREIRGLTTRPLIAIGGIQRETARDCWDAGADSVAVISAVLPPGCTPAEIRRAIEEMNSR